MSLALTLILASLAGAAESCPPSPPRIHPPWVHVERSPGGEVVARGHRRKGEPHGMWCHWAPHGRLVEEVGWDRGVRDGPYRAWGAYEARTEGAYREGERDGEWRVFGPAGNLAERGRYEAGAKVGPWEEPGRLGIARGEYVRGERSGTWTFTSLSDEAREEVDYVAGVAHGTRRVWDASGALVREETLVDGEVAGPFRLVEDGVLTEGVRFGEVREGEWTVTGPDGAVRSRGAYLAGLRHGRWEEHAHGQRVETTWHRGVKEGPFEVWRGEALVHDGAYAADLPDGTWTWYRGGSPERRLTYREGTLHGPFTAWDAAGELAEEGRYAEGTRAGTWRAVSEEGTWTGDYALGAREGTWRLEREGVLRAEVSWSQDRQHGLERRWSESGLLVRECGYAEGRLDGSCRTWREDGTPESEWTYAADTLDGPYRTWHADGSLSEQGTQRDGQPDGPYRRWFEGGALAEQGSYAAGTRVGTWTEWHPGGAVASTGRYDEEGLAQGRFTTRYADGTLHSDGAYRDGQRTGPWRWWYPSGSAHKQGEYADGLRTGEWTVHHPNGIVQKRGRYVHGAKNGRWIYSFPHGTVQLTADYAAGRVLAVDELAALFPIADPDPWPDEEDRPAPPEPLPPAGLGPGDPFAPVPFPGLKSLSSRR